MTCCSMNRRIPGEGMQLCAQHVQDSVLHVSSLKLAVGWRASASIARYFVTVLVLGSHLRRHSSVRQVFEHMQAAGVGADVVTCCSLMCALERGSQWRTAQQLFLEMCRVAAAAGCSHVCWQPTRRRISALCSMLRGFTQALGVNIGTKDQAERATTAHFTG